MKKQPFRIFTLAVVVLLLMLASCKGPGKLSYRNLADFYKPEMQLKGLAYAVFNLNDSVSNLYIRFPLSGLTYTADKKKKNAAPIARFRLSYQLYDGYELGKLVDSASFAGADSLKIRELFEDSISVKAYQGRNYILDVRLTDLNLRKSYDQLIFLPKSTMGSAADYLLTGPDFKPLLRNYINRNDLIRIRTRSDESLIRLYRRIPSGCFAGLPPFSFSEPEEIISNDSLILSLQNAHGVSEVFMLKEEGIYSIGGHKADGHRLFRFYDGFPKIGSPSVMRESLRYIAADMEYDLMFKTTPRAAVDKFWLDLTGDPERALNQIRRYYGRVEEANQLYTLSHEGWKSDRGMIYIVFGPPFVVYRNSQLEEWTYGEPGNPLSVRFVFRIMDSSNGIPDYMLIRSDEFRTPWHMAVSNWRR